MGAINLNSLDGFYGCAVKTIKETCVEFLTNFFKFLKDKKDRNFRSLTKFVLVLDNHPS